MINNEDEYIGDKSEIFPLLMDRICIEKIEVNGRPLLEILGLSSDGIFINKKAEDEFLKMVAKLQEK